jgi:DNA modification methylase
VQLINADFRQVNISDKKIDLIFTDPPYLKKFIPLYNDLGKFARDKLKDGGSLVTYAPHFSLPEVIEQLNGHLKYWWIVAIHLSKPGFPVNPRRVVPRFKPLLWFVKGQYNGAYIYDFLASRYEGKKLHQWQQSTTEALHCIERLTRENDTVCDPMAGSGTTGIACLKLKRKFIGIEVDKKYFETMKQRLS